MLQPRLIPKNYKLWDKRHASFDKGVWTVVTHDINSRIVYGANYCALYYNGDLGFPVYHNDSEYESFITRAVLKMLDESDLDVKLVDTLVAEINDKKNDQHCVVDAVIGGDGTPNITLEGDEDIMSHPMSRDALVVRTDPNDMAVAHIWRYNESAKDNVISFNKTYTILKTDTFFDDVYVRLKARYSDIKRNDYGDKNTVIQCNDSLIIMYRSNTAQTVVLNLLSLEKKFEEFKTELLTIIDEFYSAAPMSMTWYMKRNYGFEKQEVPIPVLYDATDAGYPYIKEGIDPYLEKFNNSKEPIMIFIGDPGTGKTSLVRHYLNKFGRKAAVTFDEELIGSDSFMIDFMTSKDVDTLIVEDADQIIGARDKGLNQHMNRFLNMSNGIVAMPEKKIIFSTNLKNTRDIDDALMRPGRCFDVLHFRALTLDEALAINPNLDKTKSEYTIAEAYNGRAQAKKPSMGFV